MPPKAKFTKEQIVSAALEIVRRDGIKALTARTLASALGSSACPIFTVFGSMDEIAAEVMTAADGIYQSYISAGMSGGEYTPYKASGIAYIRFAREEKQLFRLLFMRDRRGESITEDREAVRPMLDIIMNKLGLSEDDAYIFHIELWIYVHGIATMVATSYLDWDMDFISRALTDAYEGLRRRYTCREESK